MPEWSEWLAWPTDADEPTTPYLAWWEKTRGRSEGRTETDFARFTSLERFTEAEAYDAHIWAYATHLKRERDGDNSKAAALNSAIDALKTRMPLAVLNPYEDASITNLPENLHTLSEEDRDIVIMGVIDVGIPLGHNRLRDQNGKSRILAAWQQLATNPSDYLPFGRELVKSEIDDLLEDCSGGDLTGWLDEDAFNRATGVVDMENTFGVREAAKVAAHGAHVMDLAAGCDPDTDPDFAKKVKIIAINMPNVDIVGNSGEFTNGFVLSGIERIFALADAIWSKSFGTPEGHPCQCPIIINISLGKQAGAKNSLDLFPKYIGSLRERRQRKALDSVRTWLNDVEGDQKLDTAVKVMAEAASTYLNSVGQSDEDANAEKEIVKVEAHKAIERAIADAAEDNLPEPSIDKLIEIVEHSAKNSIWPPSTVNIVMPVGNDNLTRCNALFEPCNEETVSLNWRILPDDQSPNFVEVWISPEKDNPGHLSDAFTKLQVKLIAPDGQTSPENPVDEDSVTWCGEEGSYEAAIFRESPTFKAKDEDTHVLRYVLCVAPTMRASLDQQTAQAGTWRIEITNNTGATLECICSVQTDQGVLPGSSVSRRSYFDDPDYTLYNSYTGMGDARDAYAYPDDARVLQPFDNELNVDLIPSETGVCSPVRRHGTMNATAAHKYVARVGGYRKSDGKPAFYSGTGRGEFPRNDDVLGAYKPSIDDGLKIRTEATDTTRAPTASMPTEDGIMHPGVLASGGANGSVVALRGTSFAAPQAARLIAQELLKGKFRNQSEKRRLFVRAQKVEDNNDPFPDGSAARKAFLTKPRPEHLIEALGGGRIESPIKPRVRRLGDD